MLKIPGLWISPNSLLFGAPQLQRSAHCRSAEGDPEFLLSRTPRLPPLLATSGHCDLGLWVVGALPSSLGGFREIGVSPGHLEGLQLQALTFEELWRKTSRGERERERTEEKEILTPAQHLGSSKIKAGLTYL